MLVAKSSPDILMLVNLFSPDKSRDTLFQSNYANIQIKDVLTRVDGVGSITVFGARDYAMQVWLEPDKLQSLNLTALDVTQALQGQNVQVASGVLNAPPIANQMAFQVAVRTLGRLSDPAEFGNIVVKQTGNAVVRVRDVARVELTGQDYSSNSYLDDNSSVAIAVFQRPGSNALTTGDNLRSTMAQIARNFPPGLTHSIIYDPTQFVRESVNAVIETIFEAIILVVLVVLIFLQTWRAAVIPIIAIPVSLIGTFFFMGLFGFSINNLSLFGLVLAVGIVVDDAIVVVENVERNIATGLAPREAAIRSMDEVGRALVAIALVLCAVFVPSTFITGISGQFYRQFALTIAGATVISLIVSLTLSPALCALLLKSHDPSHRDRWWERPIHGFFRVFNRGFGAFERGYDWIAGRVVRIAAIMLVAYVAILAAGYFVFHQAPSGFIPQQDRGFLIVAAQLPPGSSLQRTDQVMRRASQIARATPGVAHAITIVGFSGASFSNAPNAGAIFLVLNKFEARAKDPNLTATALQGQLFGKFAAIQEALMIVVQPPPVQGIGNAGGFRMMIEDRAGLGPQALQAATNTMMARAAQTPGLLQVFSLFETQTPQIYLDIDRTKAQMLGINLPDVFSALQVYIGSVYVNDFNLFGRTFRVQAQADADYRLDAQDVLNLRVRNSAARPCRSVRLRRCAIFPGRIGCRATIFIRHPNSMERRRPVIRKARRLRSWSVWLGRICRTGSRFEWTTLAYQQLRAGNTAAFAFTLGVVFVFLVLAAQFESLTLPLAIIMIVPMCLVSAITGVLIRGQDNNILTQVGFIVLIALASKNAVLIVEFAKQLEDRGRDRFAAAIEAARLRFRPILMTSLAFVFGVTPLVWAVGAGAELRQTLGTTVFSGMIGVTAFGLIFTPVFYVVGRRLAMRRGRKSVGPNRAAPQPAE